MEEVRANFSTVTEKTNFSVIKGKSEFGSVYITLHHVEETINGKTVKRQMAEFSLVDKEGKTQREITHPFTKDELLVAARMMQDFANLCA